MPTVLVTGANRGIGLEFVRQYAAAGWTVIAACRKPEAAADLQSLAAAHPGLLALERCDVLDHASIDALAARYRDRPVDVLLNNAGIIGPRGPELAAQQFGTMDYRALETVWRTNTVGPLKMAEAFVEQVARSAERKIVTISSTVGSITERNLPFLAYASSKTAVNKISALVAAALRPRGVTVIALCPGNINNGEVDHTTSVAGMRRLIAAATLEKTGTFTRYNGESVAY